MKIKFLLLILVVLHNDLPAQPNTNCETVLNTPIAPYLKTGNRDSLLSLIQSLLHCGLDSFDLQPFFLGITMVQAVSDTDNPVVRDVYDKIILLKETQPYREARQRYEKLNAIAVRILDQPVSMENWPGIRKEIAGTLHDNNLLDRVETFLSEKLEEDGESATLTYGSMFDEFNAYEQETFMLSSLAPENTKSTGATSDVLASMDFDQALAESDTTKPILLYFNGFGAVNCRKMETSVLREADVFSLIRDSFNLINLYVDDRTEPDHARMETIRKRFPEVAIKTIGQYNQHLQIVLTNRTNQPCFAVFDHQMHLLHLSDFNMDATRFSNDLKEALAQFQKDK
jgi:hypothetical protein